MRRLRAPSRRAFQRQRVAHRGSPNNSGWATRWRISWCFGWPSVRSRELDGEVDAEPGCDEPEDGEIRARAWRRRTEASIPRLGVPGEGPQGGEEPADERPAEHDVQ